MSTEQTDTAEAADTAGVDSILSSPLPAQPVALDAANPVHFEVMSRLAALEEALLARDPMMKMHLGAIHKELIQHEELVHLLSNEQIGKIVTAQQVHTGNVLVADITGKAGKAKAAAKASKLSLSDL